MKKLKLKVEGENVFLVDKNIRIPMYEYIKVIYDNVDDNYYYNVLQVVCKTTERGENVITTSENINNIPQKLYKDDLIKNVLFENDVFFYKGKTDCPTEYTLFKLNDQN